MTLLEAAHTFHAAGLSVIPVLGDGTKQPAIAWTERQRRLAEPDELVAWFDRPTYAGLGVVCGSVSGELEMLEVEGRAAHLVAELAALLADHGHAELWTRLCSGYLEQSPSGGLHWLFRVDGKANRSLKLARRPATAEELEAIKEAERADAHATHGGDPDRLAKRLAVIDNLQPEQRPQVLIETRGEGGYVVTAPSAGRTHSTGKPWIQLAGGPTTIPTITVEERDAIYVLASMLDQMPSQEPENRPALAAVGTSQGDRPGDDYNARATWDDILTPHGWKRTKHFGGNCWGWVRPGKETRDGISATTGRNDGDNLYVFSTSTEFEDLVAYSKFSAYALLEHGGDYSAAARALRAAGYGKQPEPRPLEAIVASGGASSSASAPASSPHLSVVPPMTYSPTDDGNALRLVDTHGEHVRYCPEAGSWLRWDGHRWAWDVAGHVHELARGVARDLPRGDKAEAGFALRSMSNNGLKGMVNVARTDPRIVVSPDMLDGRPYELNTPGGVIDLHTGQLRSPDPVALHTRSTPIEPDFDAPATRWERFLADTFAGDPTLTTYIQRLLGLSLIGEHLEQLLPFGWGSGANGKSTLLNVVQGVVGSGQEGYSIPAPAELLLATHNRSHPTELARLSGARLVVASELEDGERFAESRIKMLTGGEHIAARFMGKDFFSFKPTHTIWLLANDQPAVRAGGPAFWRRLRLLPFVHVVPPEERIAGLDHQLVDEEGPAILAWLIRGAADYLAHGLAEPASVRAATNAYERDQDTVARFVEDCCELGPAGAQHMQVRVSELRASYETWCRVEGETPVSAKALTTALTGRFGVVSTRSTSARFYSGIRLTDVSSADSERSQNDNEDWWEK
jgi:putative DNA primase/helicase